MLTNLFFSSYPVTSKQKQKVHIPGGSSHWFSIEAGVSQGSILCLVLFLIYINDIVTNIKSTVRLFVDDTSQYLIVDEPVEAARCLNSHSELIQATLVISTPDNSILSRISK